MIDNQGGRSPGASASPKGFCIVIDWCSRMHLQELTGVEVLAIGSSTRFDNKV